MKLSRFFTLAKAAGARVDPRGSTHAVYPDSAILYGAPSRNVGGIMVGIDIDVAELLLADRLRGRKRIDCVLSHHPSGTAFAGLFKVMKLQHEILINAGLDKRTAAGFLEERMREVERKHLGFNITRAVDAARLLDIPFICTHTPADNCASWYVSTLLARAHPATVGDIVRTLSNVEEYRHAAMQGNGPQIILGHPKRPAGRIVVEMTGGTEGPCGAYELMQKAGISTLVSMHISEDTLRKIKKCALNAVIAGHISSDTLGMNLMLDAVEIEESLETVCCAGFRRIRHPEMKV